MAEIIVVANQKGGVGKTTTTLNLAYSLKELGKRVLVVDFDMQANLTRCFGIENPDILQETIGDKIISYINDEVLSESENFIQYDGIDIIPSSIYLSAVETQLRLETGSEKILSEIIENYKSRYDYIMIDTSPALNILTINAICASDEIVIVADTQMFAMIGLGDFLKTVNKIKKRVNPNIKIRGILLTMCNNRTNLSKRIASQVEEAYQNKVKVFNTKILQTIKIGEANYYGQSIKKYAKGTAADKAYDEFAKEIVTYE
ncbi:MAG: ParA family protein [Peptoanaerobacter stomatis]|uniref:ParA family protein n=1 Tax=Peptoanaerobacter stomatis TaxID=796937 RepID=UPI003FA09BD6